jgi:rhodanese-related sulfurtransferase
MNSPAFPRHARSDVGSWTPAVRLSPKSARAKARRFLGWTACRRGIVLLWFATGLAAVSPPLQAQEVVIQSLSRNGLLTWTNAALGGACRIEWAPAVEAAWQGAWDNLVDIPITNLVTERTVPMFYRVVSYPLATPWLTNVTAAAALVLVAGLQTDADFIILDVRMPSEYSAGRIKTALNVNYYATLLEPTLRKLDRKKTYLVYCASGNRSARVSTTMRNLGFQRIYNMTEGYSAFAALAGAAAYVEF